MILISEDSIALQSYQSPERKDRARDHHGGVMIFVKETIFYCRRRDLEPVGIECIWIELTLKHKHILFGLFYRPPNSDSTYFTSIKDSIHLAVDTGIQDIVVTGDFNFNMLSAQLSAKIKNLLISEDSIALQSYQSPERKDRARDHHGGVMIYVKETIFYCSRRDLEPVGIECIWIELTLKHKHILFGLFYRPPNSDSTYFTSIEDSIHLAVDTGIQDIVVTGDFNFNMLSAQLSAKIKNLCEEFSLTQTINQPTHFTKHSSSLLDIILTSNDNHLIFSGVGDPFLSQDLRYHCPVFGVLNFSKPRGKSYVRMT